MVAERNLPTAPLGTDGPYLVAILGVLDSIAELLAERLPQPVSEPATPAVPPGARPVKEPAPGGPPGEDDEPTPAAEPAPPPRAGRGSSLAAWRAHAAACGVTVPVDAGRDDIIAACAQAGAPH